jgi:hypothetical protein
MDVKRPNSRKKDQHRPLQDLPKFTQIGIFGSKLYHLATLARRQVHCGIKKFGDAMICLFSAAFLHMLSESTSSFLSPPTPIQKRIYVKQIRNKNFRSIIAYVCI